ncbi:ribosome-binding factor A [Ancylobacter novellus DSM 506]|jgi:ribosome-binding factor A|uniref:Ribosome-binding factor A n=1 Tax=Ancylobacter novellus (strain ATCC 8093 / DSM 506 / JCM 20403 / CCM 1077 / IAM 12100 / NBRC 12443 / NCIMB 10456) TaxID=639283 RepID=D6ZZH6_ANCN5|nr:30S ribosome-binding factor RbfA [Ancylobacter novellus]ADH91171.1 ribosome-binding factor A [Ancylobacter novellus DSM 506]
MKNRASSGSGPSQRQLRVGELVRHALAEILARGDLPDPALSKVMITVPEVRMSPDLKIATCYVMPLGGKDHKAAIDALATNAKPLRGEIARRVELKFVPELRFRIDTSFEEGDRIDALLRSPQVQRDLDKHDADNDKEDEE